MHTKRDQGYGPTRSAKSNALGPPMTTIQAVFFGVMLALTPSMLVLAFLLWRDGIGRADDRPSGETYFHRKS
jgi:hypothetical protein